MRFLPLLHTGLLLLATGILRAQDLPAALQTALREVATRQSLPLPAVGDYLVVDHYTDVSSGITHYYLQQRVNGLPIFGAHAGVHLSAAGEAVGTTLRFLPLPASRIAQAAVQLDAAAALTKAAGRALPDLAERPSPTDRYTWWSAPASLRQVARVDLLFYPVGKKLVSAYEVTLDHPDNGLEAVYVDARTGGILHRQSLVRSCQHGAAPPEPRTNEEMTSSPAVPAAPAVLAPQYEVIALPLESPAYGGRSVVVDPASLNAAASPGGWHTTAAAGSSTYSRGNNVDCYLDLDDSNAPTNGDAEYADGGAALNFSFPHVPNTDPALYRQAGITNGFYGVNVIHDILYNYGFDRPGGNFEANDGDEVLAEIQDSGSTCNANFGTPPDGMRPRTQTYLCGNRDLAFDNGITFHEVGHGVSNRLTGGPSNTSCLFNDEQMGEGWSDYLAIALTAKATDGATTPRTIGNWLGNQPATGGGIRPTPYTTDMSINPTTYGDVTGLGAPHGLGYAWATMLWDVHWAFVNLYGFDTDVYNGTGGNNKALQLVMTGMKLQACSPGFVDGRDALLAADQALYGGLHEQLLWTAFARRGLGYSATQGSHLSRFDQTEAFDMPPAYGIATSVTADKASAGPNETVTFTIKLTNNSSQAVSGLDVRMRIPTHTTFAGGSGATVQGAVVSFSGGSLAVGADITYTFSVTVNANAPVSPADLSDSFENGNPNWSSVSSRPGVFEWTVESGVGYQGSKALFGPEDENRLFLALEKNTPFGVGSSTELRFRHELFSEEHWDGGLLEITTDDGRTWNDLGQHFTQGGYNDYINNNPSTPAYSGSVVGFPEAVIDLSAFAGSAARLRFVMYSDPAVTVPGGGWTLDEVQLNHQVLVLPLSVEVSSAQGITARGVLAQPVQVTSALPIELTAFDGRHVKRSGNQLDWTTRIERNSASFVVERLSGGRFVPLAELPAAGHSDTPRNYTYLHADPAVGLHHYRLRQLDTDGSETLSSVVVVEVHASEETRMYPNPTRGMVVLAVPPERGVHTVTVYDAQGRCVLRRRVAGTQGLDLRGLPAGIYTVRLPALGFAERLLIAR